MNERLIPLVSIVVFFLASTHAEAQVNVTGIVMDKASHEPVSFASIVAQQQHTSRKSYTDWEGNYQMRNLKPDSLHLQIHYLGYHDYDTTLLLQADTLHLIIQLTADSTLKYEVILSIYNQKGAIKAIEEGNIQLLLPGGIASAAPLPGDSIFEKKYHITFTSQGCVRFPGENEAEYNREVFKYLDKTYGRGWRKEIRKDVIGLRN